MGRPNQTQDRLDALLDGRPGEVTDDLVPLLAAAEALRTELADFELDPEVVDRHLEQALDRPATVVTLPVRKVGVGGGGVLRRRLAAAGLAAALVLVPATAASAASSSALPGQALYPVKLAVEQFRLAAVQWSPTREAQERAKLAAKRLEELDRLVQLRMFRHVPPAIRALDKAVALARAAVVEAAAEGGQDPELYAAAVQVAKVEDAQRGELVELTTMVSQLPLAPASKEAITLAVQQSPVVQGSLPPVLTPVPPTTAAPNSTGGPAPEPSGPATTQPEPTAPPASEPEPATTPPTPTDPTPTDPPTTTEPPPTTGAAEGTPGGDGNPAADGGGSSPSSTLP